MNQTNATAAKRVPEKSKRRMPRLLTVKQAQRLTPNMIRVTFAGPEIADIPAGCEGAHCKIMLPADGQTKADFAAQLADGPRPATRTYTVRFVRPDFQEMDIDFVAHGDEGPASAWANRAVAGSFCGFSGPGNVKLTEFHADWYLLAADMSALPVAAATLEAMPRDAKGFAFIEITTEDDRQDINAPSGVEIEWLIHADPHAASNTQVERIRSLDWSNTAVQTCIAGESSVIRSLRDFLHNEKGIPKSDAYISGYWKIGLVEDEHQKMKRAAAA